MNIKKSFVMVLALFALACNPVSVLGAESPKQNNQPSPTTTPIVVKKAIAVEQKQVKKTTEVVPLRMQDNERYMVAKPYKFHSLTEFKQPIYTGPETIKGLVEKTASELGLVEALVVNEATHVGVEVITKSASKFLVDKEFGIPLYIVGCAERDGKPFYNRITVLKKVESKPVVAEAIPAATPTIVSVPVAPEPVKPEVYKLPKFVAHQVVQEETITVPIYYPDYKVTVHKQDIVYKPEPNVIPVQVYERPRMVVPRNSGGLPRQMMAERCQPDPRCR